MANINDAGPYLPEYFLRSARVPASVVPQQFGGWTIRRDRLSMHPIEQHRWRHLGFTDYTTLHRTEPIFKPATWDNIHLYPDAMVPELDVVMEDSPRELARHLPCWLNAHGRVLITGLGLGCVLRGLLAAPRVEHVDVVEIDPEIIRVIWPEFAGNTRCTVHCCDAREFPATGHWDLAWHDIWTPENKGLAVEHARLMARFKRNCSAQGAWQYPRANKIQLREAKRWRYVG